MIKMKKQDWKNVKALILDVDGVLTDGKLYLDQKGEEVFKPFNVRDGLAIKIGIDNGLKMGILSFNDSLIVRKRAIHLGIEQIFLGYSNKAKGINEIQAELGIPFKNMMYCGDDFLDIPVFKKVGFPVTVPESHEEVKVYVKYTTKRKGGDGAVAELVLNILRAKGKLDKAIKDFLSNRGAKQEDKTAL